MGGSVSLSSWKHYIENRKDMNRLDEIDLNQDLVFSGPVTQEELIITWKKRRQERLDRERDEAEARKLNDNMVTNLPKKDEGSEEVKDTESEAVKSGKPEEEVTSRNESDKILEPTAMTPSTDEEDDDNPSTTTTTRITLPTMDAGRPTNEEPANSAHQPLKPISILRPARLNVDANSFTTEWAKRINMRKLDKPKRPQYVKPLE